MLNKNYFLILISFFLVGLSTCHKENIDMTETEEEENEVVVVECSGFALELYESDGNIAVEVIAGTAPYTYTWSTGETTNAITVTESGVYTLSITDAIGCDITGEIAVEIQGDECADFALELYESDGTISAEVIAGTAPYLYLWSTGETTNAITVNESGVYTLSITDAIGCDATGEIAVEVETDECAGFTLSIAHDGLGQLTANVAGGTPPYLYQWSTGDNTEGLSVSTEGVYTLIVTDALGCELVDEITVVINTGDCNNNLSLVAGTNPAINFSAQSEAYLWKETCSDFGQYDYDHNYLVVDVNWDSWGTNEDPGYFHISDGLPGISFGSNGIPQIGDVLTPYLVSTDDYFYHESEGMNFDLDDIQVTITASSNEVGGQIGGVISGAIVDQNDPDNSATVSGSFCVTIVSVCE